MRKGEQTRARVTDAAADLFQQRGYHGTGLKEIIAASGAPRGSLYFHFPGGKEEIACAAVKSAGDKWRELLSAVIAASPTLADAVRNVCRALAADLEASDYRRGCPVATLALEVSAESEPLRAECEKLYTGWQTLIAEQLTSAGMAPERSATLARFTLASIEGALLLARIERSSAPLDDVAQVLAEMMIVPALRA